MINESFVSLNDNELQEVDGGVPILLIGLGVVCVIALGVGIYNGYKGNC